MSVALACTWLLVGTLVYSGLEGWSLLNGLYWTTYTMTTDGYGDLFVQKQPTRIFGIFFIYACVLSFIVALNNLVEDYLSVAQRRQVNNKRCSESISCRWD